MWAAHAPVERGSRRLLDIADKCERLTGNIVLHLAVAPAKIAGSADIVRLARASGGRIALVAGPDGLSDWQKLVLTIDAVPAAVSHYPALALDVTGSGEPPALASSIAPEICASAHSAASCSRRSPKLLASRSKVSICRA